MREIKGITYERRTVWQTWDRQCRDGDLYLRRDGLQARIDPDEEQERSGRCVSGSVSETGQI